MSEHTTGKLTVVDNSWEVSSIYDESRQCVALCHIYPGAKEGAQDENAIRKEANARRLVACWNACDGLSIEQLERAGTLDRASVSRNVAISNTIKTLTAERDSLRAVNAELLEALEKALPFMEAESVISGYGFYRPSNPNDFHPDHESCSEDEIAAHKAACEAYDAGTYNDNYGGGWVGPGLHILKAPWGIGSYTDTIPELEAQCEKARAAIASARKQGEQG